MMLSEKTYTLLSGVTGYLAVLTIKAIVFLVLMMVERERNGAGAKIEIERGIGTVTGRGVTAPAPAPAPGPGLAPGTEGKGNLAGDPGAKAGAPAPAESAGTKTRELTAGKTSMWTGLLPRNPQWETSTTAKLPVSCSLAASCSWRD